MNKLVISTLAVLGVSASAFAAGSGDVLLGFKSTNTADLSSSTFNLASVSTLASQAAGTTVLLTNVDSVLDTAFGSNWNLRTDIQWGVLGNIRAADGFSDAFGYMNNPIVASRTVAFPNPNPSGFDNQGAKWAAVATGVGGVGTNSTLLNTNTASWKFNYGTQSNAFGKFTKTSATTGAFDHSTNFASVSSYTTNLYRYVAFDAINAAGDLAPNPGVTLLGTLTLASNGDFSFTAAGAAIPEPSTYAALLGGAALAFAAIRRRRQAVVA